MANETHLTTDFNILSDSGIKANVYYYIETLSIYDEEKDERKILKSNATCRGISTFVKGVTPNQASKTLKHMKDTGRLVEREIEGKAYYIVEKTPGSYRPLSTDFAKQLISLRNSDTVKIYLWLHRRWGSYLEGKRKNPYFSKKDIAENCLKRAYSANVSKRIEEMLADLYLSGLLSFSIKRVGKTFLREILNISETFLCEDVADKVIQYMQEKGYKETTENLDDLEVTEDDTETIISFIAPQVKHQSASTVIEEKPYDVKGVTSDTIYWFDLITQKPMSLSFAEGKNNSDNYPKGMLDEIKAMGWTISDDGIATCVNIEEDDFVF